jgi:hypothetical protein
MKIEIWRSMEASRRKTNVFRSFYHKIIYW